MRKLVVGVLKEASRAHALVLPDTTSIAPKADDRGSVSRVETLDFALLYNRESGVNKWRAE
jgi:hypothetical protein